MLPIPQRNQEAQPLVSQWANSLVRSPIPFNNNVLRLTINGRTPSKKNNRICFVRNGKMMNIPSARYKEWHASAIEQLKSYNDGIIGDIKEVTLKFYAPDKRANDLSNKAESIMDLLVDRHILEDDNWFVVPKLIIEFKGIDKDAPRCEIFIERNNG